MPDSMQNEALERLKQMYSKAQPSRGTQQSRVVTRPAVEPKSEPAEPKKPEEPEQKAEPMPELTHTEKSPNMLDIFMQDKEKSLVVLLIVLLISEKADTTLILALMYLIL